MIETRKALGELATLLEANRRRKLALRQKRQQSSMKRYVRRVTQEYRRAQKRLDTELKILERQIGKADFALLKDTCTVNTPEQKNENGEVVQQASSYLNKKALLLEAKNLLALRREERIKKGMRKRSTGRSSRRAVHSAVIQMINQRTKAALDEVTKDT